MIRTKYKSRKSNLIYVIHRVLVLTLYAYQYHPYEYRGHTCRSFTQPQENYVFDNNMQFWLETNTTTSFLVVACLTTSRIFAFDY